MTPRRLGVVAGAVAVAFVALRLLVAADGDVSRFVVAGTGATNPTEVTPEIHVFDSFGYDGQFYWRLATNPTELDQAPYRGVVLDSPIRPTRIAYPVIAWAASLGQAEWAKWSLVMTNVVGMGVIAAVAAAIAGRHDRSPLVGLAVASSSGLIMALSRDLTEIVMIASLLGGTYLLARERFEFTAVCWAIACLTHEQALLLVISYGVYRLVRLLRRQSRFGRADLPWIVGGAAFGAWQLVCRLAIGRFPMAESGDATLDLPLRGFVRQVIDWINHGMERQHLLVVPQLALLIALVVVAFRSAANLQPADQWLRLALIVAVALAVTLSKAIWVGPAELRQVVALSTIAWLIIVASRKQIPTALFAATGVVWLATAVLRVAAI